jgi:uncharacterized protein (TIGR02452 family)
MADLREILRENIKLGSTEVEVVTEHEHPTFEQPRCTPKIHLIQGKGSLEIAEQLIHAGHRVCVLNFANNDIPGGGLGLKGNTQEEILMKRTTLGASLNPELYPLDDVENQYVRWDYRKLRLAYSPTVRVVRDSELEPMKEGPEMAMISCAAIRTPRSRDGRYLSDEDRDVTRRKITMILDTAIRYGHKVLIAGQWGCGAFLNPLEMCELWVEVARTRDITVVFPTFDKPFRAKIEACLQNVASGL